MSPQTTLSYRLGLISDLHAGSRYALIPPKWWNASKAPHMDWTRYLWKCWQHFCENCPRLDVLIVNGDIIEGESPSRKDAMDAITDSFLAQGEMAETMMGMLLDKAKPRQWWLTRGTSYHDGKHYETIESIARNLKAQEWADHRWTGEVLEAKWRGVTLNVTHHMTTGAIYPGTLLSRTALFAAASVEAGKANHADVIVRSHLHQKAIGRFYDKWAIMMPCWKVVTPYAIKRMEFYRATLLNDLGAVLIETDGSGKVLIDDTTFAYPSFKQTIRALGD